MAYYSSHGTSRKMTWTKAFKSLWHDPEASHWIMKIATILVPVEILDDATGIGVIDDPILFLTIVAVLWMVRKRRKHYRITDPDPWHGPSHHGSYR